MRLPLLLFMLVLTATAPARAADRWTLASPDGTLHFDLRLEPDGSLRYAVFRSERAERRPILEWSPLGVTRRDQAFLTGLKFATATSPASIDDSYVAVHGKRRTIRHRANEFVVSFVNATGSPMDLIARVSDDGAAFRYRFPGKDTATLTVESEATGFAVPAGSPGWLLPRMPAGKYTPAYEDLFVKIMAGAAAPTSAGWDYPALFSVAQGGGWLLITEAGLDDTYAGTRLDSQPTGGVYRVRLPEPGEGRGVGAVEPSSTLPWTLPWRVLIVGRTLATVFESTLVDDLSPPVGRRRHELDSSRARVVELVVRRRQPEERDGPHLVHRLRRGDGLGVLAHRCELEPDGSGGARACAGPRPREERRDAALVQLRRPAQRGHRAAARSHAPPRCAPEGIRDAARVGRQGREGRLLAKRQAGSHPPVSRAAARCGRFPPHGRLRTAARCRAAGRARIRT